MENLIFIDRDGVINRDPLTDYIKRWEDFRFEDRALESLKILSRNGYGIVIISNQAGIGDGVYPESELARIQTNLEKILKKEAVSLKGTFYCLHGKTAGCDCRKPKTGLFVQAAKKFQFDPARTYFIGDKISDIEAGKAFGLKTILVRTGHGANAEKKLSPQTMPDLLSDSLWDAVHIITK